jgi:cobalt/nickel transport system permease protein
MLSIPRRLGADLTDDVTASRRPYFLIPITLAAWLCPRDASAMHLADGILPAPWWLAWTALVAPFVVVAWRRFDASQLRDPRRGPMVAMVAAAVFAISCMPVPIPVVGSCSHPCGTGLAAIVLGPLLTVLITAIALLLQAIFLAHGGLTTLGADILSMGIAGGFVGYAVYRGARRLGFGVVAAGFAAGLLSDWATYATTSLELTLALHGEHSPLAVFGGLVAAFAPTQLPLGLLEGILTGGALGFLARRRPLLWAQLVAGRGEAATEADGEGAVAGGEAATRAGGAVATRDEVADAGGAR